MTDEAKPPAKPVRFPYVTFAAGQNDGWRKLGGPEGAFRCLQRGYKSIVWRNRTEAKAKAAIEEEEARILAAVHEQR